MGRSEQNSRNLWHYCLFFNVVLKRMACIKEKMGQDSGEIFMTGKGLDLKRFQKS